MQQILREIEDEPKWSRVWCMPNSKTFTMQPAEGIIRRYMKTGTWVDPFYGGHSIKPVGVRLMTNDLNPDIKADANMDAVEWLNTIETGAINGVLFDPPYSPRQVSECYKSYGFKVTQQMTQSKWYSDIKKQIARIVGVNGIVISFAWNSNGIGMNLGFKPIEYRLIAHGGWHYDTIITVERKTHNA